MSAGPVPKLDLSLGLHGAKSPSPVVNFRYFLIRILQLKLKVEQHEEDKLLQFIGGKEATRTHGDPSTPGHVVILHLLP